MDKREYNSDLESGNKLALLYDKVDQLFKDGVIIRKRAAAFKDKINHIFKVEPGMGNSVFVDIDLYDAFEKASFKSNFVIPTNNYNGFDRNNKDIPDPNLRLHFVNRDRRLIVPLSGNYITNLPLKLYLGSNHKATIIDVTDLKATREIIYKLICR